jgi:hypothetical protein
LETGSLTGILWRLIQVSEYVSIAPSSLIAEQYPMVWMYYSVFNQSLVERHLYCFQFRAIVVKIVMDINE